MGGRKGGRGFTGGWGRKYNRDNARQCQAPQPLLSSQLGNLTRQCQAFGEAEGEIRHSGFLTGRFVDARQPLYNLAQAGKQGEGEIRKSVSKHLGKQEIRKSER